MTDTHDLVVVGAGPAGLAAATTGASLGLRTVLLDEQPRVGGQIWRDVTRAGPRATALLGPDYARGRPLAEAALASGAEVASDALVWDVARDLAVTALQRGAARRVRAPQLVVATGALERPTPVPGWTLPGVMNAGAAQIALKTGGLVPGGPVVLAGGGPLLLLVACQLLDAGVALAGLVETSPASNRADALRRLPGALAVPSMLAKGLRMIARVRRAGVPRFAGATALRVLGDDRATGLGFEAGGRAHRLHADTVLLHHGVVPNVQIPRLLRVDHRWSDARLAWEVVVDAFGATSLPGLRVAGDGAAIAGAAAAEAAGTLAALGAARALGRLDEAALARLAAAPSRALDAQRRVRPFLDALYRPPRWVLEPDDATVVCRCEAVTAGRVREMARLGCRGPNQTKFYSRCGMGPCQGRVCGGVVTQVLARELGLPPAEVGAYRVRAPIKPVPLGALAGLDEGGGDAAG